MRVAVGERVAQHCLVLAYAHEVASPSVNADALYAQSPVGNEFQAFYYFIIESENVPINVSSCLYEVVVESGQFLKTQFPLAQAADNSSSACGTEVNCKIVFSLFHFFSLGIMFVGCKVSLKNPHQTIVFDFKAVFFDFYRKSPFLSYI